MMEQEFLNHYVVNGDVTKNAALANQGRSCWILTNSYHWLVNLCTSQIIVFIGIKTTHKKKQKTKYTEIIISGVDDVKEGTRAVEHSAGPCWCTGGFIISRRTSWKPPPVLHFKRPTCSVRPRPLYPSASRVPCQLAACLAMGQGRRGEGGGGESGWAAGFSLNIL